MSHNSQVIFQADIYLKVISQAIIYLAADRTNAAIDNATTALCNAQQAVLLLETILTEASLNQIERQSLLKVEIAYADLDFFIERLLIALDLLRPQSSECEINLIYDRLLDYG
jgi:hypothetical protein